MMWDFSYLAKSALFTHSHDDHGAPMIVCHSWPPINKNEATTHLAESWGSNLSPAEKQQLLKTYEESFDDYRTVKRALVHTFSKDGVTWLKPSSPPGATGLYRQLQLHPTRHCVHGLQPSLSSVSSADTDLMIYNRSWSDCIWSMKGYDSFQ